MTHLHSLYVITAAQCACKRRVIWVAKFSQVIRANMAKAVMLPGQASRCCDINLSEFMLTK